MNQYRFHLHTWSPLKGHADRRIKARGTDMPTALGILTSTLAAREPGVIISARAYETLTAK